MTSSTGFGRDGVLNALAYFPLVDGRGSAAVWMRSTGPGTWTPAPLTHGAANALGWTFQTDAFVDAAGNQSRFIRCHLGAAGPAHRRSCRPVYPFLPQPCAFCRPLPR